MYITTHVSTVFPLTATRPEGFKFHPVKEPKQAKLAPVAPLYATEIEVTRAIAAGTFKGSPSEAYATAASYQKAMKVLKKKAA